MTLEQLLSLVPEFRKQVLTHFKPLDTLKKEVNIASAEPEDVGPLVPRVKVQWSKHTIEGALLDEGSGVNILLEFLYKQLKLPKLEEAPFQ